MNHDKKRASKQQKWMLIAWILLWPLWMALSWYPIRDGYTRIGLLSTALLIGFGVPGLFWKARFARVVAGIAASLFLISCLIPKRTVDAGELRADYVNALKSYTDVPYVWGGETGRGIDCSGLLRAALMDANYNQGLRSANPRLLGNAFEIWWHDSSALALRDEYRGWTQKLFTTADLNTLDHARLQPGDIAITTGGNHCLAYLGNKTWIEADPSALVGDKVIQVKVPSKNAWFSQPMQILRWRQFADKP